MSTHVADTKMDIQVLQNVPKTMQLNVLQRVVRGALKRETEQAGEWESWGESWPESWSQSS